MCYLLAFIHGSILCKQCHQKTLVLIAASVGISRMSSMHVHLVATMLSTILKQKE